MTRRSHHAGSRLHDSRVNLLVGELLRRGARTKTVERLTGVGDLAIRDIHREIFKESPTRGPSGFSHTCYTQNPVIQCDSSLAANILEIYLRAHTGIEGDGPSPDGKQKAGAWLGDLYCRAYDRYSQAAQSVPFLKGGMTFERFAFLGLTLSKRAVLQWRCCERCDGRYISGVSAEQMATTECPVCVINSRRLCYRCGCYVRLDHGDIPPKRPPMCISCAVEGDRVSTLRAFEVATGQAVPLLHVSASPLPAIRGELVAMPL